MLGDTDSDDVKTIVRYAARPKLLALYALFYVGNWLSHFWFSPVVHEFILGPRPAQNSPELLGILLFIAGPFSFIVQLIGNLVVGISLIGIVRVLIEERDAVTEKLVPDSDDEGAEDDEPEDEAE